MTLELWLAFVAASTVVVLIPGPTVLMVIGDSLANRGRSWSTVLGVGAGDTVAMVASLAGAGTLLRASATAFSVMKMIGGIYLVYMGVMSIWKARKGTGPAIGNGETDPGQPAHTRFSKAFLVTVLNPKGTLFFVAFVPQFMSAEGSFVTQSAVLLATFVVLAMMNATLYASAAGILRNRLATPEAQRKVGYAGGAVLMTAGTLTLALKHR